MTPASTMVGAALCFPPSHPEWDGCHQLERHSQIGGCL